MDSLPPVKVQQAVEALMTHPGTSTPALRRAIQTYAARLSLGGDREPPNIPAELIAYVDKVTLHAYQVMDEDVQHLKEAGYSEDAIFEITLCASVGASLARLDRGLLALAGNPPCD